MEKIKYVEYLKIEAEKKRETKEEDQKHCDKRQKQEKKKE